MNNAWLVYQIQETGDQGTGNIVRGVFSFFEDAKLWKETLQYLERNHSFYIQTS